MQARKLLPQLFCAALASAGSARAAETIRVELTDTSSQPALQGMHMALDHASAKAGQVTVTAVNRSASLVHELLVLETGLDGNALPYDRKRSVFREDKIKSLGEIEDVAPGRSGSLTLKLTPGHYLLACNQPGHVQAGMWARLEVVP